ncbi:MAG: adenosylcobinamide-GDP ribazoletransferase [Bacillota bacterium]|nr:adenosylcobinamide-GDP ribazoletransferase [Bacillota bacterium]
MKYIRGFLMAWGNFSALPCPYHKWHEDSRKAMLCMLPLVGAMLAVIVCVAWWLLDLIGVPAILTGAILTALYFICNGFIHLDGFMDCSDAILSRRPELSERQRILKASDVGAFAVISVVMMLLVFAASMMTLTEGFSIEKAGILLVVMTVSRSVAADAVGRKPAMKTSQYADLGETSKSGDVNAFGMAEQAVIGLIMAIVILGVPMVVTGAEPTVLYILYYAPVAIVAIAAACGIGAYARKQLGGMNGDIAGYMVVMSETIAVLAAAVLAACLGL